MSIVPTRYTTAPSSVSITVEVLRPTPVTVEVTPPAGWVITATDRYPMIGEYYLRIRKDGLLLASGPDARPVVGKFDAADDDLYRRQGLLPARHFLVIARRLVAVHTYVETGEVRLPKRGEYYLADCGDGQTDVLHVYQSYCASDGPCVIVRREPVTMREVKA